MRRRRFNARRRWRKWRRWGGGTTSIMSEGTTSVPKDLGTTPVSYPNGAVAYAGRSYYQFTTGQAGSYIIKVTNTTAAMQWDLFAQKSYFNAFSNYIATADDIGDPVGDLIANAPNLDANTTYYLQVWDWDAYRRNVPDFNRERQQRRIEEHSDSPQPGRLFSCRRD